MDDPREKAMTRAEFLRRSAAGLTLIAVVPALGGCKKPPAIADPEDADLREMRKVEPKLVGYAEAQPFATGLAAPRGICVGAQGVAVVGDSKACLFDRAGRLVRSVAIEGEPRCAALGGDGTLFVGLTDRVVVVRPDGGSSTWESLGPRARLTCLSVGAGGLLVSDAGNRIVLRYDPNGKLLARIGDKQAERDYPGLVLPSAYLDAFFTPDGNVLLNNPGRFSVELHRPGGGLVRAWGKGSSDIEGFCGCCNPTDIAVSPSGDVFTSEKGICRIKRYGADGNFKGVVAPPSAFAKNTVKLDLAVDGDAVLVLDTVARTVRRFVPKESKA